MRIRSVRCSIKDYLRNHGLWLGIRLYAGAALWMATIYFLVPEHAPFALVAPAVVAAGLGVLTHCLWWMLRGSVTGSAAPTAPSSELFRVGVMLYYVGAGLFAILFALFRETNLSVAIWPGVIVASIGVAAHVAWLFRDRADEFVLFRVLLVAVFVVLAVSMVLWKL